MNRGKPPIPVCKAFLVCDRVIDQRGKLSLEGLVDALNARSFPTARPFAFFARWSSAHGDYLVGIQLQDAEGNVVWRDGPPKPFPMPDPLKRHNVTLTLCPVFPAPGTYTFVLLANGEEVARESFTTRLLPQPGLQ